jgi:hypothetical protein
MQEERETQGSETRSAHVRYSLRDYQTLRVRARSARASGVLRRGPPPALIRGRAGVLVRVFKSP